MSRLVVESKISKPEGDYDLVALKHGYDKLDSITYRHKSRLRGLVIVDPTNNKWAEYYDSSHKLAGMIRMRGDNHLTLDQHLSSVYNPFVSSS